MMMLQILSLCLLFSFVAYCGDAEQDAVVLDEQIAESAAEPTLDLDMPDTLNTIGLDDSGNWVQKRVWWEKAENAFGKLLALNVQISQQQINYFKDRNQIDKELDAGKRELVLILSENKESTAITMEKVILRLLEISERENVSGQKNSFHDTIVAHKDQLIALQKSISDLTKLDSDMDSVIIQVIEQVQKCNTYEASAWQDFKQIGRILNDDIAKNLYYQVINYRKNIKLIFKYLNTDLKIAFEALISSSIAKLDEIKKLVNELRENGIDLVYESKMINEGSSYFDNQKEQEEVPKPKKQPKKSSWIENIMSGFKNFVNLLLSIPKKLLNFFGVKF